MASLAVKVSSVFVLSVAILLLGSNFFFFEDLVFFREDQSHLSLSICGQDEIESAIAECRQLSCRREDNHLSLNIVGDTSDGCSFNIIRHSGFLPNELCKVEGDIVPIISEVLVDTFMGDGSMSSYDYRDATINYPLWLLSEFWLEEKEYFIDEDSNLDDVYAFSEHGECNLEYNFHEGCFEIMRWLSVGELTNSSCEYVSHTGGNVQIETTSTGYFHASDANKDLYCVDLPPSQQKNIFWFLTSLYLKEYKFLGLFAVHEEQVFQMIADSSNLCYTESR